MSSSLQKLSSFSCYSTVVVATVTFVAVCVVGFVLCRDGRKVVQWARRWHRYRITAHAHAHKAMVPMQTFGRKEGDSAREMPTGVACGTMTMKRARTWSPHDGSEMRATQLTVAVLLCIRARVCVHVCVCVCVCLCLQGLARGAASALAGVSAARA